MSLSRIWTQIRSQFFSINNQNCSKMAQKKVKISQSKDRTLLYNQKRVNMVRETTEVWRTQKQEKKEETLTENTKRSPNERHTQIHLSLTETFCNQRCLSQSQENKCVHIIYIHRQFWQVIWLVLGGRLWSTHTFQWGLKGSWWDLVWIVIGKGNVRIVGKGVSPFYSYFCDLYTF